MDNYSNIYICNEKRMFVGKIPEVEIARVATIVGTDFKPELTVEIKWYWKDDEGKSHTHKLEHDL